MKKLVSIVLVVALICSLFSTPILAFEAESIVSAASVNEEFYATQAESIRAYNLLLNGYAEKEISTRTANNNVGYPDYYGGAYIDEIGELVVLVTEISTSITTEVADLSESQPKYQLCDLSYNEVTLAIEEISNSIDYFRENGIHIVEIRDDLLNDQVVVAINQLTEEKENAVREYFDYSFLSFENAEPTTPEASYGGGYEITSTDNSGTSTIGFAATRGVINGFVIAGHAGDFIGETFKNGSTVIGTVTDTGFYNGSVADAAFIANNGTCTPTNTLSNGGQIWGASTISMPLNTTVCMLGKESGMTTGTLIATNVTLTAAVEGDYVFYHMAKANYSSTGGDSGAPVMVYDGVYSGQRKYTLLGVHHGSGNGYRYFSQYEYIVDELGVSCLTS